MAVDCRQSILVRCSIIKGAVQTHAHDHGLQVAKVMQDIVEPHGDRRQEIVFIGQGLNNSAISRALDDCLCRENDLRRMMSGKLLLAGMDTVDCINCTQSSHAWNV